MGLIRKDKQGGLPKNTRDDIVYEAVAYQVGIMDREDKDNNKYKSEELTKIGYINDAGFLTWVYTSLFCFQKRSESK
jgi:hypothetical protein